MLREFSIASRQSRESHTSSIQAGEIATSANVIVYKFRGQLTNLSEELSQYTISFNKTLLIVQGIAITAAANDEIINELRVEASVQAAICVQKVNNACV